MKINGIYIVYITKNIISRVFKKKKLRAGNIISKFSPPAEIVSLPCSKPIIKLISEDDIIKIQNKPL